MVSNLNNGTGLFLLLIFARVVHLIVVVVKHIDRGCVCRSIHYFVCLFDLGFKHRGG